MNKLTYFSVLFALILTSLISCQERSKSPHSDELIQSGDSLLLIEENTRSLEEVPVETGISLIGKWKLVERKMGVQTLEMQENEESTLEFTSEGMLVSESDGFDPESYPFTRTDDLLSSDLWDTSQSIKSLTSDELVLIYQVDGVQIDHIYQRVQ